MRGTSHGPDGSVILVEKSEGGYKSGNLRARLFYCDPQASHQKGSLENNHIELRYIWE